MTTPGICEVTGKPGFIDSEYTSHCLCLSEFSWLKCGDYLAWIDPGEASRVHDALEKYLAGDGF